MNIEENGLYSVFFIIGFNVWFDDHRFFFLSMVWFPANDVAYCYTKLYIHFYGINVSN